MISSIIAMILFAVIVLLSANDIAEQKRESERINRAIERENMRQHNAEQDMAFRITLNREQLLREYTRWDVEGEWD